MEFGVERGCDEVCSVDEALDFGFIVGEILEPAREVEVLKIKRAQDQRQVFFHGERKLAVFFVVVDLCIVEFSEGKYGFGRICGVLQSTFKALDLVEEVLHGESKGRNGAFEALEKVDLHHADQKAFAISLAGLLWG